MTDAETLSRHRAIWRRRPELQAVYREYFATVLGSVAGLTPVVEVGTGPGFLKEFAPRVIATDVVGAPAIDVRCDAGMLPFRASSVGALVMIDALHHLPRPLAFLREAARVLRPAGRVAMIEPWITPASYLLFRYLHHEECRVRVDLDRPFTDERKAALDGNAAIPYLVARYVDARGGGLRVVRIDPFVALPYLLTFGFKVSRPLPHVVVRAGRLLEVAATPLRRLLATRVVMVLERAR